jgi:hypothetical protein
LSGRVLPDCLFLDFLGEVPLVTFRILRTVTTLTIKRVLRFLQDCCACFPGAFKMSEITETDEKNPSQNTHRRAFTPLSTRIRKYCDVFLL